MLGTRMATTRATLLLCSRTARRAPRSRQWRRAAANSGTSPHRPHHSARVAQVWTKRAGEASRVAIEELWVPGLGPKTQSELRILGHDGRASSSSSRRHRIGCCCCFNAVPPSGTTRDPPRGPPVILYPRHRRAPPPPLPSMAVSLARSRISELVLRVARRPAHM